MHHNKRPRSFEDFGQERKSLKRKREMVQQDMVKPPKNPSNRDYEVLKLAEDTGEREETWNEDHEISIPFYAPRATLPADLPNNHEIENPSTELVSRGAVKVIDIAPYFVVKYGAGVDLAEGRMMLFISQNTNIPVPRVYALYQEDTINYIIMERINGQTLENMWPSLTDKKKKIITDQLQHHLQELRAIPSPKAYCSLDGQPLQSPLFWIGELQVQQGPFKTISELVDALVLKFTYSPWKRGARIFKNFLPGIFDGHPPVLTHGDLQKKNVMVKEDGDVVVILDWAISGWYPDNWEFAAALDGCQFFDDDYVDVIYKVLPADETAYLGYRRLRQDIGL